MTVLLPVAAQVRIKNRLNPLYDGRETAGYRNVVVNLRLDVDLTR